MIVLVRNWIPLLAFIAATFFIRFLGSEGTAIITSSRLGLIGILIFAVIFLFNSFSFHLKKKYGSCLVLIIYLFFFFCVFFYFSLLRIYCIALFGRFCSDLLFGVLVLSVGGGQGLPSPSGPSSSNPQPNPLGIDLNFPPSDESVSTSGLQREVEVVDQGPLPLSEAEEKIRFRLSHTPAYNSPRFLSEVREIANLKGILVDLMVELDTPFSDFWRENREAIIGDSLLTNKRTEYGSHRLQEMVETLRQADARTSSTFKQVCQIRIKYFKLGSLKC